MWLFDFYFLNWYVLVIYTYIILSLKLLVNLEIPANLNLLSFLQLEPAYLQMNTQNEAKYIKFSTFLSTKWIYKIFYKLQISVSPSS
jgi:hypothetical protein